MINKLEGRIEGLERRMSKVETVLEDLKKLISKDFGRIIDRLDETKAQFDEIKEDVEEMRDKYTEIINVIGDKKEPSK